tara:strand:- start:396157 stop:396468 length:312 start_codon:yes stop_codon:yes gene_type:complete
MENRIDTLTAERDETQAKVRTMCHEALAADAQFRDLQADLAAMTADRDRLREVVEACHSAMCSAVHELENNPRKHLKAMLAIQQAQPIVNAAREQQAGAKGGE